MKYEQIMAYVKAGLLIDSDFEHLTDEELWWIVAEREEPIPDQVAI